MGENIRSLVHLIPPAVIFFVTMGAMMVGTIPIVFPIILYAGIDPVWFGIFLVLMMELALITPPVGMNLYVVQGIRGQGTVSDLFVGILPFVAVIGIFVAVIIVFPALVTWLPGLMF